MGQGQSLSDGADASLAYHPSAVGYSVNKGSQSRQGYPFQSPSNGNGQHGSTIGPMRTRVKGKQSFGSPTLNQSYDSPNRDDSHSVQGTTIQPRLYKDELPGHPIPRIDTTSPSSSSPPSSLIPASPNASNRGDYRISAVPGHPSIVEVPEPETADSAQIMAPPIPKLSVPGEASSFDHEASDHGHTPEPVPSPLIDALKSGLGKRYLSVDSSPPSLVGSHTGSNTSSHVRNLTDETTKNTLLAYWDKAETESLQRRSMLSVEKTARRHSWNSSREEGSDGASIARTASPYRTVAGRWTSQWEDRRGLGISAEEVSPQSSFQGSNERSADLDYSQPTLSGFGKVKRKPIPSSEEASYLEGSSTQSTPIEVNKQHILWPATVDEMDEVMSKRSSHLSRASATTDALHSHVEKMRAGPRYQIDRSASSLFLPPELICSSSSSSNRNNNNNSNSDQQNNNMVTVEGAPDSPARKRPRALSLMAKIKGRVRKTSDAATIASSPVTISPSTPAYSFNTAPHTPMMPVRMNTDPVILSSESLQRNVITSPLQQEQQQQQQLQQQELHHPIAITASPRGLYGMARRPSKKSKAELDAIEADFVARVADTKKSATVTVNRRPNSSLSRRSSSRQSLQSVNSAKSIRSKRSSNVSLRTLEQRHAALNGGEKMSNKVRSNSQPLPNQQQWWKSHVVWPRRGSGAGLLAGGTGITKDRQIDDDDGAWVDEEAATAAVTEDDRGIIAPVARNIDGTEASHVDLNPSHETKIPRLINNAAVETRPSMNKTSSNGRSSPPLALIGKSNEASEYQHHQQQQLDHFGYSTIKPSSSFSSTFSSLAPPPAPAPVPPPRPSRKTKRTGSSSNGGDSSSSSPTSPILSSGKDHFDSESGSYKGTKGGDRNTSPLSLVGDSSESRVVAGMGAFVPATSPTDMDAPTTSGSARHSKDMSDAGSKEILLSEDSEDQWEPTREDVLQGDEGDYHATVQPYLKSITTPPVVKSRSATTLSPVKEMRRLPMQGVEGGIGGDDHDDHDDEEEEEDGITITERSDEVRSRKASMGLSSTLVSDESGLKKRPLPAPPILAEPRTDLQSVTRSNSIGSSQAGSMMGGQASVASMKKHTSSEDREYPRRPLPPTPKNHHTTNVRPNRSFSMPSKPAIPFPRDATYEIVQAADATEPDVLQQQQGQRQDDVKVKSGSNLVRESWTSADGPWHADIVVASSSEVKSQQPTVRGYARPAIQPHLRMQRQRSSSSPLDVALAKRGDWTESRDANESSTDFMATDPVPFAETAVQASLAALAALERSEQGNDWRSRWAREKLMGSSPTTTAPLSNNNKQSKLATPTIQLQPSISEMSDYSHSRIRRRAAPYSRSREDNSSSADERARRSARKKKQSEKSGNRRVFSSSASQVGGHLTSDTDQAVVHERMGSRGDQSSLRGTLATTATTTTSALGRKSLGSGTWSSTGTTSRRGSTATRRAPIPSFTQPGGLTAKEKEDWDEKIVPALAKRLEVEAEQEAKMVSRRVHLTPSPVDFDQSSTHLQRQESGYIDPMTIAGNHSFEAATSTTTLSQKQKQERRRESESKRRRASTSKHTTTAAAKSAADERDDGSDEAKTSRSTRRTKRSTSEKKKPTSSSATSLNRMPKIRKGYGCDDIKAWQASLSAAAPPTTLVE